MWWQAWHLALFLIDAVALWCAGVRAASRVLREPLARIVAGSVLACAAAVGEALLLGLVGLGANAAALSIATAVLLLICSIMVPASTPGLGAQMLEAWGRASRLSRSGIGALGAFLAGWTVYLLLRPAIAEDGLAYHLSEPAVWLGNGHPGSMHGTLISVPVEAYPRTMEVLFAWAVALARTATAIVPMTVALFVLLGISLFGALRALGVPRPWATVAGLSVPLMPMLFTQANGVLNDVPALVWLTAAFALATRIRTEPGAVLVVIVALACGVGTKTTVVPLGVLILVGSLWGARSWLVRHRAWLGATVVGSIGIGGVWYLMNWAVYGAPLYPFSGFPNGHLPPPFTFTQFTFANHPILQVIRYNGYSFYLHQLGGGLFLLAGVVVVVIAAVASNDRRAWPVTVGGAVLVGLELLLWMHTPFTVLITGFRYIAPVPLTAAAVLALSTRYGAWVRRTASLGLGSSLLLDLWELRLAGYPFRPPTAVVIALVLGGAVAALVLPAPHRALLRWIGWALAPAAAAVALLVMVIPADTFDSHHLPVARALHLSDAPLLAWFDRQPGWAEGRAPMAIGPEAFATLAGHRFTHPLSLVTPDETCGKLRAAARQGWVVVQSLQAGTTGLSYLHYRHPLRCLADLKPLAVVPGYGTFVGPDFIYGAASFEGVKG